PAQTAQAQLAEDFSLDLRIVYLSRAAGEIISSTVKRGFGTPIQQAKILLDNAMVMAAQMDLIDPAFVECFSYD
ncbi:unnamed protein product, partial [Discosporangium mesarthrocarpum]